MLPVRPARHGQDALGLDEVRARAFRREPGARGLYPKSKPPFLRVVLIGGERMRPGDTQTKRGAAVRMRRRLGLAPRACVLLSCSLVLVVAGVSAYGMTVPSMVQAHAARELHIGRKAKSDLGTTTGYAWASVVGRTVFGVDRRGRAARQASNEITLANGKTIVLTNTKVITIACPITAWLLSVNKVGAAEGAGYAADGQARRLGRVLVLAADSAGSDGGSGSGSASGGGSVEWWLDGRQCRRGRGLGWPLSCRGGEYSQLARDQIQHARWLCHPRQ